ncbi:MAG: murein biosynthesis integral membrane protein MurJ [Alphaproteobacteria bacterium]|nr:murein biosynthesis integral membrane protein MurJ [Alphaproteobacteria bacterium]
MALFRAIATLGSWTMASRVLGLCRDILFAGVIGAGMVSDAFFVAFKFPNFFRRLFAEGAFNAAFVPLFTERLVAQGGGSARAFGGAIASVMVSFMLIFTAGVMLAMPWLMFVLAPGFADQPEKFGLAIELARLTFPYLLFMALCAMLGGMLNAHRRFAAAAAAPILLNIVLISAMLLVRAGVLDLPGHALAAGVAIAGAGQFIWLVWGCVRAGIMVRLPRPRLTPGVRRLLVLMVPALIGAGVMQINLLIDLILASFLAEGSISWLYYADRVNQLPIGLVGVAVGVALLPLLSRHLSAGEESEAMHMQNRAIEFALLLTVPAAAALIVMPDVIATVLYQRHAFGPADTLATANALTAFAAGLPAYVLVKALTPGFFARQDTVTPVKIAVAAVITNVFLAVILMQVIAHVGLALALAIAAWLNAGLLGFVLHRRGHFRMDARLRRRLPRQLLATAGMAAALWFGRRWLDPYFAEGEMIRVAALVALVAGGAVVFAVLALAFGAVRRADLRDALKRK